MIAASWMWPRYSDFTAQKIMASCFLFKKINHTIYQSFSTNQQYIQKLHRLELQTTILIEDACVDTDAWLQPHTIGTIWKNGWDRLAETQHDRHTDGHPLSISLACKPFILKVIPRMNRYHWWIWWLGEEMNFEAWSRESQQTALGMTIYQDTAFQNGNV